MKNINDLWLGGDKSDWDAAINRYWCFVNPENEGLERELEFISLSKLRNMSSEEWYEFLLNKYFKWKYTAKNRLATTSKQLRRYVTENRLHELSEIKDKITKLSPSNIMGGLFLVTEIHGLGTAGASGLLSLIFPEHFGTVDQFVVKALREVNELDGVLWLQQMDENSISLNEGVKLIYFMKKKADELNSLFQSDFWNPRKIDQVLWTYGRE